MTGYYQTPGMSTSSWGTFVRDITPIISSPMFTPGDLDEMKGKVYSPVRIDVTNVQLKEPTKGDKFLAELLEEIKEPLSTAIVSELTPTDNTAAKRDSKIALQEAAAAYSASINADKPDSYNIELQKLKFDKACEAYKELGGTCMALPIKSN